MEHGNNWGSLLPPSTTGTRPALCQRRGEAHTQPLVLPWCLRWLCGCLPAWWELRPARPQGILISFTVEPDRAYSGDVMKTDDPIPSLQCFGEGENYSLHPGGMLCGSPCLAPVPHLISTSLAVFFLLSILMALCLSLSQHPAVSPATCIWSSGWERAEPSPDHQGCRAQCWDKLGGNLLQLLAAHSGQLSQRDSPQS